jgi:hypothetical protein
MGEERFPSLWPELAYSMDAPESPAAARRHVPAERPAAERVRTSEEVSLGLSPVAAAEEAARCLRCDVKEAAACPAR